MDENDPQLELPIYPPGAIAIAYEGNRVMDYPSNWETCQTLANQGYRIVVMEDDTWSIGPASFSKPKEEIQAMCDYELRIALDCFGQDYAK